MCSNLISRQIVWIDKGERNVLGDLGATDIGLVTIGHLSKYHHRIEYLLSQPQSRRLLRDDGLRKILASAELWTAVLCSIFGKWLIVKHTIHKLDEE